jgi:hypothetical protein
MAIRSRDDKLAELDGVAQVVWKIVERNLSLFEGLNSESDNELSVLASSHIIEGIEDGSEAEGMTGIDGDGDSEVTRAQGVAGFDSNSGVKATRYGRRVRQAIFRVWRPNKGRE